jgi:hypothetical protein
MSYSLGYDLSYYAEVIVEYLFRYRGMTATQIAHILYGKHYTLAQEKSVYNYLRKLKKQKLVTSYRLQGNISRGSLYYLTEQGYEFAKYLLNIEQGKKGEGWIVPYCSLVESYGDFPYDLYKPTLNQLPHHLMLIEFFKQINAIDLDTECSYRTNLYAAKEYIMDGKEHHYRPDAELKFRDGRIFAVEIDRATESHEQLRRKFRTYRNYLQYLHSNNKRLPSGIFFVVEEKRREHGIRRRWENVMSAFFEEMSDFHKNFNLIMTTMNDVPETILFEFHRDAYERAAQKTIENVLKERYDKVLTFGYYKENPIKIIFSSAINISLGTFDLYGNAVCHEMDTALYSRLYDFYQRIVPAAHEHEELKLYSLHETYINVAHVKKPTLVRSLDSYEVDDLMKKIIRSLQTRSSYIQLDRIK